MNSAKGRQGRFGDVEAEPGGDMFETDDEVDGDFYRGCWARLQSTDDCPPIDR